MSDNPPDLTVASLSTAREKVLEHRLLSELAVLMLQRGTALDILRSEFDAQGHDVVLEAAGTVRHVQLKATRDGGKRREVDINVRLRARPSGCVVWMNYDPQVLTITSLRWFGGVPGEPLPELGSVVTRHSKGDSIGTKHARPALRNLGIGKFERLEGLNDLADRLFGPPRDEVSANATAQLRHMYGQVWKNCLEAQLTGTTFDRSCDWAHLIDGYALVEQALEPDASRWLDRKAADSRMGKFSKSAGSLWAQLFLEHRRWRFASPQGPDSDEIHYLDELAVRTEQAIRQQILTK